MIYAIYFAIAATAINGWGTCQALAAEPHSEGLQRAKIASWTSAVFLGASAIFAALTFGGPTWCH